MRKFVFVTILLAVLMSGCCNDNRNKNVIMEKPWTILDKQITERSHGSALIKYTYQDKNGRRGTFTMRDDRYIPGDQIK